MEPLQAVLALGLALVLALGPGLLTLDALRPSAGWVRNVAVAPAVSLGLLWVCATVLALVHLPVSAATVLPVVFGAPLLASLVRRRHTSSAGPGLRVDRLDVAGIGTGVLLAVVLWVSASQWLRLGVPNDDGSHHGFYTARILTTSSLDPAQVLVGDVLTGTPTYDFYPLALHLMAAMIAATGLPVAVALNAAWVVLTSLGLGAGMSVLARRTFPAARRVAVVVAVLAPVMSQIPFGPIYWGGVPLLAGMALLPGVVDAAVGSVQDAYGDQAPSVGAALGLAATGLFFTHSSDLLTAGLLTVCLLWGSRRERSALREALRRPAPLMALLGCAGVVVVLAAAPYAARLVGGAGERTGFQPAPPRGLGDLLRTMGDYLVGPGWLLLVLGVPLVVGLVVGVRRRLLTGWLWFSAVVITLMVALGSGWPGSVALTTPWYRDIDRLAYNLVYPGVIATGFGIWWIGRWLAEHAPRASAPVGRRRRAGWVSLALLVPLTAVLASSHQRGEGAFTGIDADLSGGSLAGADARAAFAWLAAHSEPGDRVLNEFADGSAWMYAESRVLPLFGAKVSAFPGQWDDREYLLQHAAQVGTDPVARASLDTWKVRFAYRGGRLFPDHEPSSDPALTVAGLVAGGWRVVFTQGDATVLEPPAPR